MNAKVKMFFIAVVALSLVVMAISLIIPSNATISRTISIDRSLDMIMPQVTNLTNWKNWHPMFQGEGSQIEYISPTSYIIKNNGKEVTIKITHADSTGVYFNVMMKGHNDVQNAIIFIPTASSETTQVEWRVLTHLKWYPWEKVYGIFVDKISGSGYELALTNLKNEVEKQP